MRASAAAFLEDSIRERLAAGDLHAATSKALMGYGPHILSYLIAVLQDEAAGHDVFAQFCENLWKSVARFRGESLFRTWAYRLAWCAAEDYRREPFRRRADRVPTAELSALVDRIRDTTPAYLRTPVRARLATLRDELPPADRSMLVLRFEEGLSWKEVAAVMAQNGASVDEAALRKRFQRLRERVRELAKTEKLFDR